MDKDYRLESLKATMKFLKTQDKSIKLASYNTKKKILDYLQSINYDFSGIPKAKPKGRVPRQPKQRYFLV